LDQAAVDNNDDDITLADLEELNFWNALSQELLFLVQQTVQHQLASPPVQLTLAMLREVKRYVQISFLTISKFLVDVDDSVCAYFLTK
jgi:hypothetical protein